MNPQPFPYLIREMDIADHPQLLAIWKSVAGLSIDEEDSYDNMITFLNRNPKLNYVAEVEGKIVATLKGAQDGRRGYISHVAVLPEYRSHGLAKIMYEKTLEELRRQGIWKCNLYVMDSNPKALDFWRHNGWKVLNYDFRMLQRRLK